MPGPDPTPTFDPLGATVDWGADTQREGAPAGIPFEGPRQVGRFLLLRQLGAGGMGTVYVAYDEKLDRRVAIKLLHASLSQSDRHHQLTLREAQAMARVAHPNVVAVFEVGEYEGQVFIAMEFVDGTTLATWQKRHAGDHAALLSLYLQAGEGLLAAHKMGLVHRDFKPDNVLVDGTGRARVADFGLARLGEGAQAVAIEEAGGVSQDRVEALRTVAGTLSGTPGYMSPEQYRAERIDSRSDQFSFCAALYEALYGQLPFAGETLGEQARNCLANKLRPPPHGTRVPPEIFKILSRGMMTDASARYPSLTELLAALRAESSHSAAGSSTTRRRFLMSAVIAIVLINITIQLRFRNRTIDLRELLPVNGGFLIFLLVGGLLLRRKLLHNTFHRRMWGYCTVYMAQYLAAIALATHYDIPTRPFYTISMVMLAGFCSFLAIAVLRVVALLVPLIISGIVALVYFGDAAMQPVFVMYPVAAIYISLAWDHAGRRAATVGPHRQYGRAPPLLPGGS